MKCINCKFYKPFTKKSGSCNLLSTVFSKNKVDNRLAYSTSNEGDAMLICKPNFGCLEFKELL